MEGRLDKAELLYHQALSIASRSGFLQDAAIINELFAEFFLNRRKSPDDALYKMKASCGLYEEWGCHLKAEMLRAKYGAICTPPQSNLIVSPVQEVSSTSLRPQ